MGKTAATTSGTIKQVPFPSTVCFRLLGKVDQRTNVGLSADAKLNPAPGRSRHFLERTRPRQQPCAGLHSGRYLLMLEVVHTV